ncbi:D-serine/D-alanine/glycine transporter [Morganella morganii]|nr:D-serine/D-alanine/glycine transporter [Morganella morganii]
MGSGKTISLAGPSVLFVYIIIGFVLFFVMRAMAEILLSNLNYKSFSDFACDLIGPWAGFFVGWTYWFCWVITGIADVVAITGYIMHWAPDFSALGQLAALYFAVTVPEPGNSEIIRRNGILVFHDKNCRDCGTGYYRRHSYRHTFLFHRKDMRRRYPISGPTEVCSRKG